MPAFSFEKLSPPVRRVSNAPIANKKQRGVISSMLDRLVEARSKRRERKDHTVPTPQKPKA